MSLKSLINNTIANEANKPNGIGEKITYISRTSSIDMNVIVETPDMNKIKDKSIKDLILFHGINIPLPVQSDIIVYNGVRYRVHSFKRISSLYDIYATKSVHKRGAL